MNLVLFGVLVFAVLNFGNAEDDGQYHPELYGDNGSYHPTDEGHYYGSKNFRANSALNNKYKSLLGSNGKYDPNFAVYQPVYLKAFTPHQHLLAPLVKYGDQNGSDQDSFASSLAGVTFRPPVVPVVPTVTPIVYASTLKPQVKDNLSVYAKSQYNSDRYAHIVKQNNDFNANAYHYLYQTQNGINAEESGRVESSVSGGTVARGFYEYIGNDGVKYRVDYIADENGFQPSGVHLPQV